MAMFYRIRSITTYKKPRKTQTSELSANIAIKCIINICITSLTLTITNSCVYVSKDWIPSEGSSEEGREEKDGEKAPGNDGDRAYDPRCTSKANSLRIRLPALATTSKTEVRSDLARSLIGPAADGVFVCNYRE